MQRSSSTTCWRRTRRSATGSRSTEECVIEFIDDPNFGTGLTIRNPNFNGCASCGGGCH